MNKEYIPYEQALELKELGFYEDCLDQYTSNGELSKLNIGFRIKNELLTKLSCSAPLYQQAFRWFRENHKIKSHIGYKDDQDKEFAFYYYQINWMKGFGFQTYEEAELACLKKLIEIVKNKL